MKEESYEIRHLAALIESYCNSNTWSKKTPLYFSDLPKISEETSRDREKDGHATLFHYLDQYLAKPVKDTSKGGVSATSENKLLNVVKLLQNSLTNEDEDGIRICAYEILHRCIVTSFPVGYSSSKILSDTAPALQAILQFLVARLDDLPCTESVIDCIFTLLVLKDSAIVGNGNIPKISPKDSAEFPHAIGISIPLPVIPEYAEIELENTDSGLTDQSTLFMPGEECITAYPQTEMYQYRWLKVSNVAFILSEICEKVQLDYLRSKHRRQVYDVFRKYLLAGYYPTVSQVVLPGGYSYFHDVTTYGTQLATYLLQGSFLENFLRCFENERDPQNVLSFLQICQQLTVFSSTDVTISYLREEADFFDSFSCFFPLAYEDNNFRTRSLEYEQKNHGENAGIYEYQSLSIKTKDQLQVNPICLKESLHRLLSCSCFHELSVPFLLDKLDSPLLETQTDVLDVLRNMFRNKPSESGYMCRNSILLDNLILIHVKATERIQEVLKSDDEAYDFFHDTLFKQKSCLFGKLDKIFAFETSHGSIQPGRTTKLLVVETPALRAWIEMSSTIGENTTTASQHKNNTDFILSAINFIDCVSEWSSRVLLSADTNLNAVNSLFDRTITTILKSTMHDAERESEYTSSWLRGSKALILIHAAFLQSIGPRNQKHLDYFTKKLSPLLLSRMNEITQERSFLTEGSKRPSGHMERSSGDKLSCESITVMTGFKSLLRMTSMFSEAIEDSVENRLEIVNRIQQYLETNGLFVHGFEYLRSRCSSSCSSLIERRCAVDTMTEMAMMYSSLASPTLITELEENDNILHRPIIKLEQIIQSLTEMHINGILPENRDLYLTALLKISVQSDVSLQSVIRFTVPKWKTFLRQFCVKAPNNSSANEGLSEHDCDIIRGFCVIASIACERSHAEIFTDIVHFLFEVLEYQNYRMHAARGILCLLLLDHDVSQGMIDITQPFYTFFENLLKRRHTGSEISFHADEEFFETVFWIFVVSLRKELFRSEDVRSVIAVSAKSILSLTECFLMLLSRLLSLKNEECRDVKLFLSCYEKISHWPLCADLCKYLPVAMAKSNILFQWMPEYSAEWLRKLSESSRSFSLSELNDSAQFENIVTNALFAVRWRFYSGLSGEIESLLDEFFGDFTDNLRAQNVLWKVISRDGVSDRNHIWKKLENFTEYETKFKYLLIERSMRILQDNTKSGLLGRSIDELSPLLEFILTLSIESAGTSHGCTFLLFLTKAIARCASEFSARKEQIFMIVCIGLSILKEIESISSVDVLHDFLRIAFVPLSEKDYSECDAPMVSACLDIFLLLQLKATKEVLLDTTGLPHDLKKLLPDCFFTTRPYAAKDCILQITKKVMEHPRRFVRQRGQRCRHLYALLGTP